MALDSVRSTPVSTPPSSRRDRDLDEIRATYDRYRLERRGRLWDPTNPGFARMMADRDRAFAALLRLSLPPGGGVLDLGCGDGRLASVARDHNVGFERWVGVDLDPVAVDEATASVPWATFLEASGDRLPFESGSFDVVIASTLFSSLTSMELESAVASEIGRVIAPWGWLVWYDLRYDNPRNSAVHGIDRRRLASLFPGWRLEVRSMTLLPPVARRLGVLTRPLYGALHAIPALRSHLVGRLRPSRGA